MNVSRIVRWASVLWWFGENAAYSEVIKEYFLLVKHDTGCLILGLIRAEVFCSQSVEHVCWFSSIFSVWVLRQ